MGAGALSSEGLAALFFGPDLPEDDGDGDADAVGAGGGGGVAGGGGKSSWEPIW